jgi:hypothetical protein
MRWRCSFRSGAPEKRLENCTTVSAETHMTAEAGRLKELSAVLVH